MRSIARLLVPAALVACFVVMWSAHDDQDVVTAQLRTPVKVTRLYTGPDGQTHAEEADVKLTPGGAPGQERSETIKVTALRFQRMPPGWVNN